MAARSPLALLLSFIILASGPCFGEQRVFSMDHWFQVPDGTYLAPFFNPKDCMSQLPWDLADAYSIAAGEISEEAAIVVHPIVTQMTFVLSGRLEVIMKELDENIPSTSFVEANQAVLIRPGAFFQLRNAGDEPCRVLYIVSPAYLFELDKSGNVVYDDAVTIPYTWKDLERCGWKAAELLPLDSVQQDRTASYGRLSQLKASVNG